MGTVKIRVFFKFAEDCPAWSGSVEFCPGVCCASRMKPQKIARKAIFYPANSVKPKVRSGL
jgi:hypothetical protein